jgi:hypothetical protein
MAKAGSYTGFEKTRQYGCSGRFTNPVKICGKANKSCTSFSLNHGRVFRRPIELLSRSYLQLMIHASQVCVPGVKVLAGLGGVKKTSRHEDCTQQDLQEFLDL